MACPPLMLAGYGTLVCLITVHTCKAGWAAWKPRRFSVLDQLGVIALMTVVIWWAWTPGVRERAHASIGWHRAATWVHWNQGEHPCGLGQDLRFSR